MPKSTQTSFIIVDRDGKLHVSFMKNYCADEIRKQCKCKPSSNFELQAEWAYSGADMEKFIVELWGHENGVAGNENKYEFPPPVDTTLFFGSCALVAKNMNSSPINLTIEKWEVMYDFLFGGFDAVTSGDDYEDDDEIPASLKTKDGYLKDGFVVDNDDEEEDETSTQDSDEDISSAEDEDEDEEEEEDVSDFEEKSSEDEEYDHETSKKKKNFNNLKKHPKKKISKHHLDSSIIVNTAFELVEEPYEYFDDIKIDINNNQ